MTGKDRWLIFVLLEDCPFEQLLRRTQQAFGQPLQCKDDEGRYVASAQLGEFEVQVIDKEDRLGEFLSDDHYTLRVAIHGDDHFTLSFENRIKALLAQADLKWQRFVWAPDRTPAQA
ncbi:MULTISPECIES: hypothetical protein [Pseudomonas]|uniref:hypothetical protein n=1 Tax=Pseudomonas TaxID=286 RepID=UPI0035130A87